VRQIKGRTYAERFGELGAEYGNWAQEREVTGEWRRLHTEELYDLYCSPDTIRVSTSRIMRLVGHVARMCDRRGTHRGLVGRPECRRPLGRRTLIFGG